MLTAGQGIQQLRVLLVQVLHRLAQLLHLLFLLVRFLRLLLGAGCFRLLFLLQLLQLGLKRGDAFFGVLQLLLQRVVFCGLELLLLLVKLAAHGLVFLFFCFHGFFHLLAFVFLLC